MVTTQNPNLTCHLQFCRKQSDGNYSDWKNLPQLDKWPFIEEFLPDYHGRADVDYSYGI